MSDQANPLDDPNAFTEGHTRPKMLMRVQEMMPYFSDLDLAAITEQITMLQATRKLIQQGP